MEASGNSAGRPAARAFRAAPRYIPAWGAYCRSLKVHAIPSGNARTRANRVRAATPAPLKGLTCHRDHLQKD